MRTTIILLLSLATFISPAGATGSDREIYVSPRGNDTNPGTMELPLQTLKGARDHVRELKADGSGNITVWFRGGTYPLSETVVFGPEDSGQGESFITYAAYPGEKPVFSSGKEITGWEKVREELPGLPEAARGKILVARTPDHFLTLYDEEGLLPRARSEGFLSEEGENTLTRLHFPDEMLKNWPNLMDVEIKIRPEHAWVCNILPLESVDEETGIAKTSLEATYPMNRLRYLPETLNCWVENILEELDEPGEWVLNTKESKVYLWPRNESPVVAPQLLELIRVEGSIDIKGPVDIPVRNLRFRGLSFKHGERYTLTPDDAGLQHDWDMLDKDNALVRFRGTENCAIENCHFLHSGSGAIRVDLHGMFNKISGNHIEYMGGGGILLCGYGPGTKDVNKENTLYNNHIHHVGEIYWHSPGIFLWQSGENRVSNNLIHHTNYTAMILSGCMSQFFRQGSGRELFPTLRWHELKSLPEKVARKDALPYLHTHDNLIEYNEIHHAMLKLGDGNAIYVRGAGENNVIRRNYIHHMVGETQMQAAIRTDGGQTGTLITENLIYKCTSQGILLKLDNSATNNIVADIIAPPRGYYLSVREGPLTGTIQRNIYYAISDTGMFINELPPGKEGSTEDSRGRKLARVKDAAMEHNIYYWKSDPDRGKELIRKNQADGVDLHSLAADPMFADPENGDFSFKPGSPALKMGFIPIDLSKIGLRNDPSLINSDGSTFIPRDFYPKFSWETTPQYFMFQDRDRVLDPEEVSYIAAKTDFICIEKSHAKTTLGAAELGTRHEVAAFKKINPDIKVLFYFNSAYAWPYTSYNKYFTRESINAHPELKEFLIKDPETGDLAHRHNVFFFDVLNPEFRKWWAKTVAKGIEETRADGVFIDQMHGFVHLRRDRADEIERAMGEMMADLKGRMGPDKILLSNNANRDDAKYVYPISDALMFENYAIVRSSKENLLVEWEDMLRNAREGKISVFRLGVEGTGRGNLRPHDEMITLSKEKLEFALACYLIGAQPYSYFMYSWGWLLSTGPLVDYPELQKPLGAPLGPYKRSSPDGWEFTREFEYASVRVDTEKREACISWKTAATYYVSPSGNNRNYGTSEKEPFRTVQFAIDRMSAGDTLIILDGIYTGTLQLKSGITLKAKNPRSAVFSPAEPLDADFEPHTDKIFKARINKDIKQLFFDGKPMTWAQWPDMSWEENWDESKKWASAKRGTGPGVLCSDGFSEIADLDLTGGYCFLRYGKGNSCYSRRIEAFDGSVLHWNDDNFYSNRYTGEDGWRGTARALLTLPESHVYHPIHSKFFLAGDLDLLNAPGEWYVEDGILYFYPPEGKRPGDGNIRVRSIDYCIDQPEEIADVCIEGLDFFGGSVRLAANGNSSIRFYNTHFTYPGGELLFIDRVTSRDADKPNEIAGTDLRMEQCLFAGALNTALKLSGSEITVQNCVFLENNRNATFEGRALGLNAKGPFKISRNTFFNNCSDAIRITIDLKEYQGSVSPDVSYNNIFNAGIYNSDVSGIYMPTKSQKYTEVHHNWMHNVKGNALRLDVAGKELNVHHNVFWQSKRGMSIEGYGQFNIYNNTDVHNHVASDLIRNILNHTGARDASMDSTFTPIDDWNVINNIIESFNDGIGPREKALYARQKEEGLIHPERARSDKIHNRNERPLEGNLQVRNRGSVQGNLTGDISGLFTNGNLSGLNLTPAGKRVKKGKKPDTQLIEEGITSLNSTRGAYDFGDDYWVPGSNWMPYELPVLKTMSEAESFAKKYHSISIVPELEIIDLPEGKL